MGKNRRQKKRKSTKGALIKGMLGPIPRSALTNSVTSGTIKNMLENRPGMYILYHGQTPYYVGMGGNVRWRLFQHFEDRHKNKWDHISIFLSRKRNIKDLETLLLNVLDPPGNRVMGRLPPEHRYTELLLEAVKLHKRETNQFERLLKPHSR